MDSLRSRFVGHLAMISISILYRLGTIIAGHVIYRQTLSTISASQKPGFQCIFQEGFPEFPDGLVPQIQVSSLHECIISYNSIGLRDWLSSFVIIGWFILQRKTTAIGLRNSTWLPWSRWRSGVFCIELSTSSNFQGGFHHILKVRFQFE